MSEITLESLITGMPYLDILNFQIRLSRHEQIRVQHWVECIQVKKFKRINTNPVWKQNKVKYAHLLLQMVKQGRLKEPFSRLPPDGSLPNFEVYCEKASLQYNKLPYRENKPLSPVEELMNEVELHEKKKTSIKKRGRFQIV